MRFLLLTLVSLLTTFLSTALPQGAHRTSSSRRSGVAIAPLRSTTTTTGFLHPALVAPPVVPAQLLAMSAPRAQFSTNQAAYALAWRRALATTSHTSALRVADALARSIGLRPGPARITIEQFIDQQMGACPACYPTDQLPAATLEQMIRLDVGGFQRALSAVLPDQAYFRYIIMLDEMGLKAQ